MIGVKIESKVFDPSHQRVLEFINPDPKADLRVQCNAFNNLNKGKVEITPSQLVLLWVVIASTESVLVEKEHINWLAVFFITFLMILVIAIIAAVVIWKQNSMIRSVYEMDPDEIDTLLKKTKSQQKMGGSLLFEDGDDIDTVNDLQTVVIIDRNIRCNRCG